MMPTLEMTLSRSIYTERSTIGELWVGPAYECLTLEDIVRPPGSVKVPGRTAIPAGRYGVIINQSVRFKRLMPLLLNVPGFQGVRIHAGNTDADTEGCILVGRRRGPDRILDSRAAYDALFLKLQGACVAGKVFLTIEDTGR